MGKKAMIWNALFTFGALVAAAVVVTIWREKREAKLYAAEAVATTEG